jgi:hypothetical protein
MSKIKINRSNLVSITICLKSDRRSIRNDGIDLPSVISPALSLLSVSKRFGATQALDDVDLAIGRGEVVALMGANGAEKSSLAIAAGDDDAAAVGPGDPAAISYFAAGCGGRRDRRPPVDSSRSHVSRFPAPRRAAPADRWLDVGGERQIVAIARALMPDP